MTGIRSEVIFVEDDEDVMLGSTQALDLAGFETTAFASVELAQAHVSAGEPAVVVCDVKLPGRSGVEWLSDLRALDPELPVILITGHGDIAMAVQAMRDGAYDFIEKPCTSERLVVGRAPRGRQAQAGSRSAFVAQPARRLAGHQGGR